MNTANNRRRKDTVEKTEKAFVELLQTKDLEEITLFGTVQEGENTPDDFPCQL